MVAGAPKLHVTVCHETSFILQKYIFMFSIMESAFFFLNEMSTFSGVVTIDGKFYWLKSY